MTFKELTECDSYWSGDFSLGDMKKCWNAAIDACIEKFWTLDPAGRLVPSLEELKEK